MTCLDSKQIADDQTDALLFQLVRLLQRPLAVSHLLLDGRYRGTLADALRRYRPQMVVLSPALPAALRDTLALQAAVRHLPVHDIARHGALIVPQP